ncbi:MAG: PDZ domain-containing protein [Acidimicrobiia bacterium]
MTTIFAPQTGATMTDQPGTADAPGVGHGGTTPPAVPARRRWPLVVGLAGLAVTTVVVAVMAFIRVPYVIISPGDATALDDRVLTISDTRTYDHRGEVLFLTVRITNRDPNLWRWLFAQLDDDVRVDKREQVLGCATYDESGRFNDELMQQSQDVAKEVALERLGYDVPERSARVLIVGAECDGPSHGKLLLGDEIVAVDGTPVASAEEVRPLVVARAPGERILMTIRRGDDERDVAVRLGSNGDDAFLGISTQTFVDWDFPVDISIDTLRVSGPSAGLAFALAIVDGLTPGELTGGVPVAVTGSMAADGSVGVVGGVEQKAVTARRNGARLMIVPAGEAAAARRNAGEMKVVAVETFDDALRALAKAGGAKVPAAPPVPQGS